MYGLVEVKVSIVRKAYRFLKNDKRLSDDEDEGNKSSFLSKIKGLMRPVNEKAKTYNKEDEIYSIEQKRQIREILAEIVYASYISTSEHMMVKIEIASIIQDIIDLYSEKHKVLPLNNKEQQPPSIQREQENRINV